MCIGEKREGVCASEVSDERVNGEKEGERERGRRKDADGERRT